MSLQVFPQMDQRSDAWHEARRGLVTASTVGQLLTTRRLTAVDYICPACSSPAGEPCIGARGGPIKTMHTERTAKAKSTSSPLIIEPASNDSSRGLTKRLVAERITGQVDDNTFISDDMQRGIDHEPYARDRYAEVNGVTVEQVGFMVRDVDGIRWGCSPDGLINTDGMLEVKCPRPATHIDTIIADTVPIEHMPQLQCALLTSGRQWIDFVSFVAGLPLYTKRVFPDARWTRPIYDAIRQFEANAIERQRLYAEAAEGLPSTERIPEIPTEMRFAS
ncbi:YqaJ viral recombinase family protein [Tsukamurella conjunctivitidis]|uniref:YqaJ viral recombinase family protein n=1 Tax=Tsukamurella conjunctivitidis TaxID=2592068 RepID=A0A5C5RRB7_9ACTN|nr:lambda exonuclease family protein [Tsukamurella conjunctivitidis]TWS25567.1 YqaJ viral recombinase family protein [Tsukamurella conjunctivitidis]